MRHPSPTSVLAVPVGCGPFEGRRLSLNLWGWVISNGGVPEVAGNIITTTKQMANRVPICRSGPVGHSLECVRVGITAL